MRIGILSAELDEESRNENRRLIEEIVELGHDPKIINYQRTYSYISNVPALYQLENDMSERVEVDAVIPRINEADPISITGGVTALRTLVLQGIPSLASPEAIDLAKNKFNAQLVLAATGIRTPRSVLETAAEPTHLEEVLSAVEPDADRPVIIKRNVGTNGIGVELFTNRTFAMAGLAAHPPTQTGLPSIIQEFIPPTEERPFDLRLVTVGQVVVAAMKRIASEGEFRSNIAQGGTGHEIQPTIKELKAAESTSKVINSDVLGIDIMLDNSEPLVIEVNVSPGFYIETVSGVNLPRLIAKAAIEKALKARSPSGSR